jgi:hypothetical protein
MRAWVGQNSAAGSARRGRGGVFGFHDCILRSEAHDFDQTVEGGRRVIDLLAWNGEELYASLYVEHGSNLNSQSR